MHDDRLTTAAAVEPTAAATPEGCSIHRCMAHPVGPGVQRITVVDLFSTLVSGCMASFLPF